MTTTTLEAPDVQPGIGLLSIDERRKRDSDAPTAFDAGVKRKDLRQAIAACVLACPPKSSLPILLNLQLTTDFDNKSLDVLGTDLETFVQVRIPALSAINSTTNMPARYAKDLAKLLDAEDLQITNNWTSFDYNSDRYIDIKAGNGVYTMGIQPHQSLAPRDIDHTFFARLEMRKFLAALQIIKHAMSSDETRRVLTSVLFVAQENGLTLVATDTHRLVKLTVVDGVQTDIKTESGQYSGIVPSSTIELLCKVLTPYQKSLVGIHVLLDSQWCQFVINTGIGKRITITSQLIDGEFPVYNRVSPKSLEHPDNTTPGRVVTVNRLEMLGIIRRLQLCSKDYSHRLILCLHDKLKISTGLGDDKQPHNANGAIEQMDYAVKYCGGATESFGLYSNNGKPKPTTHYEIAINCVYLKDCLSSIDSPTVNFEFRESLNLIRVTMPGNPNWHEIVMPMQVV